MSVKERYDSMLWEILEKNRLADLSQFHKSGFSDEAPLYSRQSDIDFLMGEYDVKEVNAILLSFALKYLQSVIAYETHPSPYFAAITVWNFSKKEPLIPNIFAHSKPEMLKEILPLQNASTPFGKQMVRSVVHLEFPDAFDVLEDTGTDPEMERVFIGPSVLPYKSFFLLRKLRKRPPLAK